MPETTSTITFEMNWDGMRRWVRHVARTDPEVAQEIAEAMGDEAPDLSDIVPNGTTCPDSLPRD